MFENIPTELKGYKHWLVWKGIPKENGKIDKPPLQVANGYNADITNPAHWGTFEEAVAIARKYPDKIDGIGFALNCVNPYAIIDLDDTGDNQDQYNRQLEIYKAFNSYSEYSPSGKGIHIVCKGKIPQGRRRDHIEVYSQDRYITFTGKTLNSAPIEDRQSLLDILWAEMGAPPKEYKVTEGPQKEEDEVILKRATHAQNGEKFMKLWLADYGSLYPSQSEADFALVDILAFYTNNLAQIERLFKMSNLGKRAKAYRNDYIKNMVYRSFDRQLPYIDIDGLRTQIEQQMYVNGGSKMQEGLARNQPASPSQPPVSQLNEVHEDNREAKPASSIAAANLIAEKLHVNLNIPKHEPWPPGLLGEITKFIYAAAPRPVFEMALGGAIGFMAGVCGKTYNISGTGLNQYILVLGITGTNKEQISGGISKIMLEVKTQVPSAMEFIGPGEIRSDAGLLKWISKNRSFVSVVGEFGYRFQQMTSTGRNNFELGLKRVMLDLYNKSGKGSVLSPMAYSDNAKNTDFIHSPSFTLLGESTPESFYSNIDEDVIYDGLLPRFLIIEYHGLRPALSKTHMTAKPQKALIDNICTLTSHCLAQNQNNQVIDVQISPEALEIFDALETKTTNLINNSREVGRQIWNRVHIKTLKLAALVAVGVNPWQPFITKENALWAQSLVDEDARNIYKRFDKGDVGQESSITFSSDKNQLDDLVRIIAKWIKKEEEPIRSIPEMNFAQIYTYSSLQQRVANIASFRKSRNGSNNAFNNIIKVLIDSGDIEEVNPMQIKEHFGKRAKCFRVVDSKRFTS